MQSIRTIEDRSGQQYYVFRTWKLMPNRDWVFESFNAEFLQYKKLYDVVTIKLESLLKSP